MSNPTDAVDTTPALKRAQAGQAAILAAEFEQEKSR
jgi:hypothetical protein